MSDYNWKQSIARIEQKQRPDIILDPKVSFQKVHDDIFSISWFQDSDFLLIFGTEKQLKICDIRQSLSFKHTIEEAHNNNVFDIKFDPFDQGRFASVSDETIKIFDLRNTKKALFEICNKKGDYF